MMTTSKPSEMSDVFGRSEKKKSQLPSDVAPTCTDDRGEKRSFSIDSLLKKKIKQIGKTDRMVVAKTSDEARRHATTACGSNVGAVPPTHYSGGGAGLHMPSAVGTMAQLMMSQFGAGGGGFNPAAALNSASLFSMMSTGRWPTAAGVTAPFLPGLLMSAAVAGRNPVTSGVPTPHTSGRHHHVGGGGPHLPATIGQLAEAKAASASSSSSATTGVVSGKLPALKKYKCDVCAKAFSRSNTLITHKRIHTGEKPFKCEHCGRAFRQPGNLTRHRLTHTTVKPYICQQCAKAFNRASNLHTHMRTHSSYRPFVCPYCGKGFHQKIDMKIHIYTHTEVLCDDLGEGKEMVSRDDSTDDQLGDTDASLTVLADEAAELPGSLASDAYSDKPADLESTCSSSATAAISAVLAAENMLSSASNADADETNTLVGGFEHNADDSLNDTSFDASMAHVDVPPDGGPEANGGCEGNDESAVADSLQPNTTSDPGRRFTRCTLDDKVKPPTMTSIDVIQQNVTVALNERIYASQKDATFRVNDSALFCFDGEWYDGVISKITYDSNGAPQRYYLGKETLSKKKVLGYSREEILPFMRNPDDITEVRSRSAFFVNTHAASRSSIMDRVTLLDDRIVTVLRNDKFVRKLYVMDEDDVEFQVGYMKIKAFNDARGKRAVAHIERLQGLFAKQNVPAGNPMPAKARQSATKARPKPHIVASPQRGRQRTVKQHPALTDATATSNNSPLLSMAASPDSPIRAPTKRRASKGSTSQMAPVRKRSTKQRPDTPFPKSAFPALKSDTVPCYASAVTNAKTRPQDKYVTEQHLWTFGETLLDKIEHRLLTPQYHMLQNISDSIANIRPTVPQDDDVARSSHRVVLIQSPIKDAEAGRQIAQRFVDMYSSSSNPQPSEGERGVDYRCDASATDSADHTFCDPNGDTIDEHNDFLLEGEADAVARYQNNATATQQHQAAFAIPENTPLRRYKTAVRKLNVAVAAATTQSTYTTPTPVSRSSSALANNDDATPPEKEQLHGGTVSTQNAARALDTQAPTDAENSVTAVSLAISGASVDPIVGEVAAEASVTGGDAPIDNNDDINDDYLDYDCAYHNNQQNADESAGRQTTTIIPSSKIPKPVRTAVIRDVRISPPKVSAAIVAHLTCPHNEVPKFLNIDNVLVPNPKGGPETLSISLLKAEVQKYPGLLIKTKLRDAQLIRCVDMSAIALYKSSKPEDPDNDVANKACYGVNALKETNRAPLFKRFVSVYLDNLPGTVAKNVIYAVQPTLGFSQDKSTQLNTTKAIGGMYPQPYSRAIDRAVENVTTASDNFSEVMNWASLAMKSARERNKNRLAALRGKKPMALPAGLPCFGVGASKTNNAPKKKGIEL